MKTKQEVIDEFNQLVDEGWKKAYYCLLDNNVFIGDLSRHAILMGPDRKPTHMSASGLQQVGLMSDVGMRFNLRGNRHEWKLKSDECWTKDEIDAEIANRQKMKANAEKFMKTEEYQEYLRLKKKFEPFIKCFVEM